MSSETSSMVNDVYNRSADLGNTMSYIYLVGALIVGVILVICAIINFFGSPQTTIVKVGTESKTTTTDPHTMALISLVIAIFVVGLSYLNYYMATHYKAYASYQGAQTIKNLV